MAAGTGKLGEKCCCRRRHRAGFRANLALDRPINSAMGSLWRHASVNLLDQRTFTPSATRLRLYWPKRGSELASRLPAYNRYGGGKLGESWIIATYSLSSDRFGPALNDYWAWVGPFQPKFDRRTAGIALGGLALLVILVLLAARGGGVLPGEVTVGVPPAYSDRIYGAPEARGRPIVVLDAGHGGSDPGARGVSGSVNEKDLTLAFARERRDLLVERGRVRVAMTRESDTYVPLEQRAAVARRLGAALFVSLHMDSAANPLARGASVYSLSDVASDAEAARIARSVNGGSDETNAEEGSVKAVLADLSVRSRMSASADLASRLVNRASGKFELRPEPHKFAAFHVLRSAQSPAILFEGGYLSNVDDEALLRDPKHRHALALALAEAIESDVASRSRR